MVKWAMTSHSQQEVEEQDEEGKQEEEEEEEEEEAEFLCGPEGLICSVAK